jgi:glycosyltransferase involved in cell wall biosynthesis
MNKLSVILIVRNEAANITACLDSVRWADEIIVLDSGSCDNTIALCQAYTDNVVQTDWQGFGVQKNRALALASHEWVLSIDADERVSPALRQEIEQVIQQDNDITGWFIPRNSHYCGRLIRHSGWSPDHVLRLFKRECGQFTPERVHEKVLLNQGQTAYLHQPLLHYSFADLDSVLAKINAYSRAGAAQKWAQGQTGGLGKAVLHGLWTFLRTYVLRLGFLDGQEGFMLAVSNAEGVYYRYLKLLYLQKNSQ